MAFKGLRFAGLEWKNITASKIMWVVIAAIAIMPLLYGALYLAAFQDPYARLNTVPVAVVNEDRGAVIAAEQRNLGDDVVQQLKDTDDGLGWHFVSADEARKGLEDGEYFMTCTIPVDFSESIASVDGSAPEKAQLKIDYNQSENMLASQIGETVWKEVRTRVSDTVAAEYWTTVLGRVADSGKDIQKAADGADDLKNGLITAHDGSVAIMSNLGTLKDGALTLDTGLGSLVSGASSLDGGLGTLSGGTFALKDGTQSLVAGANQLKDGAGQVASGASQLAQAAPELVAGIGRIDAGANEVNANMSSLVAGSSKVASGASQVNDGASSAVSGANQLDDGAAQLVDGVQAAKNGAGQLVAGTQSAKDGSAQIASGAVQLEEGSGTLASGLTDAVDGSGELSTALADGAKTAAEQTTNIDGKSEVMSDPVELANEYYTTVKNYGTGFAPYFMALGLWVGGLVAGFVFKPLNSRLIMSGANPVTVAFSNYLPVAFFSLIQATLLMVVLQFGLQLQIDNVPAFYAMGYLTALVFAAIMQMLMAAFGFPGKFVAIILLMLQLTACAGTFPIQTTPDFFQVINPYMPMTYVVQGMRQIMTGLDYGIVGFDCFVLFAIGAACFALTCLVAYRKRTVRMEDLHPVLQLG